MDENYKKSNLFFIIFLIIFSLLVIFIYVFINKNSIFENIKIKARKGVVDLSNYDLNKIDLINLDGEWEFYYNRLYLPSDFNKKNVPPPQYVNVPSYWTKYKNIYPKPEIKGYATYRLKIKVNKYYTLGLFLDGIGNAYRLYINGNLYHQKGLINRDFKKARFRFASNVVFFQPENNFIDIVIQVQNKDYFKAGIYRSIKFGTQKKIFNYNYFSLAADLFIFGIIFIMAVYNFLIFLINKKEFYYLFLSIFILSIGYKTLSGNQLFINSIFPKLYLKTDIKVYDFFLFLLLPAFNNYLYFLFQLDYSKVIFTVINFISIPIILSVFIVNVYILNYVLYVYEASSALYSIYLIFFIIKINLKKRALANFLSYAILLLIISTFIDIFNDLNIFHFYSIFPSALTIFIFIQTVALTYRFMLLYNQINFLQKKIEILDGQKVFADIGKNYSMLIHNIKNKINIVSGYKELLSIFLHEIEKNPGKINFEKIDNILKMQDKNIMELSNTLTNLSYYVKTQINDVKIFDVNKLLSGVILSYQINSEVLKKFEIKSEFIKERIFIKANSLEFSQIFDNLITNSIDACCSKDDSKEVTKGDEKNVIKNEYINKMNKNMLSPIVFKTYIKNDYCIIEYSDKCGGITFCNNCKKLNCLDCDVFQIGKTTKIDGSGQGMVFIMNKVREFNGNIKIISKKDEGTTFIFAFPFLNNIK